MKANYILAEWDYSAMDFLGQITNSYYILTYLHTNIATVCILKVLFGK